MTFRPPGRTSSGGGVFLGGAVLGGLGGLILLAVAILALLPNASWPSVAATVLGGVVVGALLPVLTSTVAHRPVTTELPLIIVWTTAQLATCITSSAAGVLRRRRYRSGRGERGRSAARAGLLPGRLAARPGSRLPGRHGALTLDGVLAATLAAIVVLGRAW